MVEYKYNAWGLCKIMTSSGEEITDSTHIGHINPFRYRGYYYSEASVFTTSSHVSITIAVKKAKPLPDEISKNQHR